jgi:GNAT superfamily N-acetyltransferase
MMGVAMNVTIAPASDDVVEELERNLLEALRQNTPPSDYVALTLAARDGAGRLVGGLAGGTSYGWLLVKILWVAEAARGRGLGARLMAAAEQAAQARRCHGAWLDTSSRRAEAFYCRLGYAPFGVLENQPGDHAHGHRRAFLCKRFAPADATENRHDTKALN